MKIRSWAVLAAVVAVLPSCGGSDGPSTPTPPATQPTPFPPTPLPPPAPPAVTVNGDWRSEARAWYYRLEQRNGVITGSVLGFRNVQYPPGTPGTEITGTIDGNRNVSFRASIFEVRFSGRLDADGRRMTGETSDCGNGCRSYGEILIKQ